MTGFSCNLSADNRQRYRSVALGVQHRLCRVQQSRDLGRQVLTGDALSSVSQQYLAIAIANTRGFEAVTERVFQIVSTLRKSRILCLPVGCDRARRRRSPGLSAFLHDQVPCDVRFATSIETRASRVNTRSPFPLWCCERSVAHGTEAPRAFTVLRMPSPQTRSNCTGQDALDWT